MLTGKCACGAATYQLSRKPMFVHCCHCTECQRLSGSAYALNALIETDAIRSTGELTQHIVPTPSGKGQQINRCAACGTALFSHYLVRGSALAFLRVGTLDDPSTCPPDVHIWTESKQDFLPLSVGVPVFKGFYDASEVWPEDAMARRAAVT